MFNIMVNPTWKFAEFWDKSSKLHFGGSFLIALLIGLPILLIAPPLVAAMIGFGVAFECGYKWEVWQSTQMPYWIDFDLLHDNPSKRLSFISKVIYYVNTEIFACNPPISNYYDLMWDVSGALIAALAIVFIF